MVEDRDLDVRTMSVPSALQQVSAKSWMISHFRESSISAKALLWQGQPPCGADMLQSGT